MMPCTVLLFEQSFCMEQWFGVGGGRYRYNNFFLSLSCTIYIHSITTQLKCFTNIVEIWNKTNWILRCLVNAKVYTLFLPGICSMYYHSWQSGSGHLLERSSHGKPLEWQHGLPPLEPQNNKTRIKLKSIK